MPSEREIRKLYVNGQTICIEFFFCLSQIFSVRRMRSRHRRWQSWGLGGYPSTSILAGAIRPKLQNMYMFALLANKNSLLIFCHATILQSLIQAINFILQQCIIHSSFIMFDKFNDTIFVKFRGNSISNSMNRITWYSIFNQY